MSGGKIVALIVLGILTLGTMFSGAAWLMFVNSKTGLIVLVLAFLPFALFLATVKWGK